MKVNYDFSGRVVLIAGAGSGIGLAMTHACLAAGATVLASDVRVTALSALQHPKCHVAPLDITDSDAVNRYVAQQCVLHQRIDAAVLASGIQQRIEVEAMTDADWRRHLDVNLTGIFYVVRALFPVMKRQRGGATSPRQQPQRIIAGASQSNTSRQLVDSPSGIHSPLGQSPSVAEGVCRRSPGSSLYLPRRSEPRSGTQLWISPTEGLTTHGSLKCPKTSLAAMSR